MQSRMRVGVLEAGLRTRARRGRLLGKKGRLEGNRCNGCKNPIPTEAWVRSKNVPPAAASKNAPQGTRTPVITMGE